jgi:RNA recognition motif-containing protein
LISVLEVVSACPPYPTSRSPPRAEHEIYIGNYPLKFREADVRKLFKEHGVEVGAIRMKHDGLKV